MRKFYFILSTNLFFAATLLTTSVLNAGNWKKLMPEELKDKTVILEKIILRSHANTLTEEDMKNFIDNYLPSLVADFEKKFSKKYNSTLDISAYQENVIKKKVNIRLRNMGGVVMGSWTNRTKTDFKATLLITIEDIKQKITVAGKITKEDPVDHKNPFSEIMSYFYTI